MIDTTVRDSPGWWLLRLARKLEARQPRLNLLADRYEGDPPLPEGAENCRDAYRSFQRKARTNYAELIVAAVRERMTNLGFRTAAADDENGDAEARRIWDENGLAIESADVHENMLSLGDAYVIVGLDDETGRPIVTGEDPRQVVTIHDPVRQRVVRGALKMFHDDEAEQDFAYLFLPGVRYVASRPRGNARNLGLLRFAPSSWEWVEDKGGADGEMFDIEGGDTVVPVVRFRNRRGVSEFENHVDLLDRINHQILQRMVIATMQAFRQRAVKNVPIEDEQGKPIDYDGLLRADPGAVWLLPGDADLWESGQADLNGILSAVKDDVRDLAAVTRTPLSYLTPDAASQSAEGASLMREGLVFKAEDRIARASEGWRDVMSLAFLFAGDTVRAERGALEPLWAPAERRSLAERADAGSKAQDIPFPTRMTEIWQFTPAQVARMETERAAEPPPVTPPPVAGAPPDTGDLSG